MQTDYKTVFQLAQDKGYKCRMNWQIVKQGMPHQILPVDELELFELTLIQKWLRDEHELSVYAAIPVEHYWNFVIHGTGKKSNYYTDSSYKEKKDFTSYESALLEGIHEALKLL